MMISSKIGDGIDEAEQSQPHTGEISLMIGPCTPPSEENLPSHLFPGAGSDTAWFEIQGSIRPSWAELSQLLVRHDSDFMLMEYNAEDGRGYFVAVDSYAPKPGLLVLLPHQSDQ